MPRSVTPERRTDPMKPTYSILPEQAADAFTPTELRHAPRGDHPDSLDSVKKTDRRLLGIDRGFDPQNHDPIKELASVPAAEPTPPGSRRGGRLLRLVYGGARTLFRAAYAV